MPSPALIASECTPASRLARLEQALTASSVDSSHTSQVLLKCSLSAGTTLSVLRVDGLMGQGCRMFDSPGVPHSHQLTALLTLPEVKPDSLLAGLAALAPFSWLSACSSVKQTTS